MKTQQLLTTHPLVSQLEEVNLSHPFTELGWLTGCVGQEALIRAWYPKASQITVCSTDGAIEQQMTCIDHRGLFELGNADVFAGAYRLRIDSPYAPQVECWDPYAFKQCSYQGLEQLEQSLRSWYRVLGAQLMTMPAGNHTVNGVRFVVYAPNASSVSVIGDFNHWDGRRHPMERCLDGHWVLFMPELKAGQRYKYELKDKQGAQLPHKADPIGFYAEQYPSLASVIWDHSDYEWTDQRWQEREVDPPIHQPMSIYEVHIGSWKRKHNSFGWASLSYRELATELVEYVKEMGYTHIELMPISEHPFDGSWGYQPVGLFSPTSRYGNPDDFKYFIDCCHQAGIGVIIDWVPAHFPADAHGLARFDGTTLYEYSDPRRGWHKDWNSYIYDFGRDTVRRFLIASALIWFDYYHVDGLRVDAVASMLYWDYSREEGEWIPNVDGGNQNYEAISLLKWFNEEVYREFPRALTVAEESTAFSGVSRPTYLGGLGFGFKWNMGWMHDSLQYMQQDPLFRKYHHNEITFAMVYNYDENFILPLSHDEVVHGKGALLGKMPGDEWQQAANLRVYTAFMFAHPGKKLSFMGNEIAQVSEWNHDGSVEWTVLEYPRHYAQQALTKALNHVYRQHPALYEGDHQHEGFKWIDYNDWQRSILAFERHALSSDDMVIVVCNFTPTPVQSYRLGVPQAGHYQVIFNSDDESYWGSGMVEVACIIAQPLPWQGRGYSIVIPLPPLAAIYLVATKDS
ncbi:1,4-alpha-glucan branching protein GlgB [Celerinatantimonas yamalensis]|uniref:1,4-alpha-glucan branching enzyme GlgB n=1 Tax=Celerinatantimonas yamalensis TaxID=559956 RepID=A0ABW9G265_9GAMM